MEILLIYGLLFGGFILAFICLVIATMARSSRPLQVFCFIGAIGGLIYEVGCLRAAASIGSSTGGGGAGEGLKGILGVGAIIIVLWIVALWVTPSPASEESDSTPDQTDKTITPNSKNEPPDDAAKPPNP